MATITITPDGNAVLDTLLEDGPTHYLCFSVQGLRAVPTLLAAKLVVFDDEGHTRIRLTPAGQRWVAVRRQITRTEGTR